MSDNTGNSSAEDANGKAEVTKPSLKGLIHGMRPKLEVATEDNTELTDVADGDAHSAGDAVPSPGQSPNANAAAPNAGPTPILKKKGIPKIAMAVAAFRQINKQKEEQEDEDFRILKQTAETKKRINEAKETTGILADDAWVPVWESTLLCATLYFEVVVSLNDIYDNWTPVVHIPLDLIGCGMFCVDTVVRIFMARSSVQEYSKYQLFGWICYDLISAPPWHLIAYAFGNVTARNILYHLPLLRIFRVVTYFEQVNPDAISAKYVYVYYQIVPMIQLLFWTLWFLHLFVICRLALIGDRRYESDSYNIAVYYVLYTVTTVGYGDIEVQSTGERSFACFLFVFGAFANAGIIGKLSKMMQAHDIKSERKARMMETLAVMKYFNIPKALQHEVLAFQNHILQHNVGSSYAKIINGLPSSMQEHIGLYVRVKFISAVEMFQSACDECKVCLAEGLKNVVYAPGDYIIRAGEVGMEMFFMGHGYADVLSPEGSHLATIKKGGFFGEIALLIETLRTASIRALTYCDLFRLDRTHFHRILDGFPEFNAVIQQEIATRKSKIAVQKTAEGNDASESPVSEKATTDSSEDASENVFSNPTPPDVTLTPRSDDSPDEPSPSPWKRLKEQSGGHQPRKVSQCASSSCDPPIRVVANRHRDDISIASGVVRRSIAPCEPEPNLWSDDAFLRHRFSSVGPAPGFNELKDLLSQISSTVNGVENRLSTLEMSTSKHKPVEEPTILTPTMRLRSTIRNRILGKRDPVK